MGEWKNVLIPPGMKIHEMLKIIDRYSLQIALVAEPDNKLLGTVTDGDVRRGLLNGVSLDSPVEQIMNRRPVTIPENIDEKSVINILKLNKLRHLPVVDESGRVTGLQMLDDRLNPSRYENWVVIMAGGLGSRLRPMTDNCPKPMLNIGNRPILETIIKNFLCQGFYRFCLSVNYRSEQIRNHFGDGTAWGAEIRYIDEENRMGTAGSLSLFPVKTEEPVIVMNGDILTKLSFEQLIAFHLEHRDQVTVAVRTYDYQVPYGIVKVNRSRLAGFEEKPVFTSLINAGIYVLNPGILEKIPANTPTDMNQLLEALLRDEERISVFPIREYWIDIGSIEEFNQAELDFFEVFG